MSDKTFWTVSFMLSLFLAAIENHDNDDKFTKLYNKYEKKVFSIAFEFTKDQYDAEDASQMAFFALARNIEKIDLENENATKIYVYKAVKSASFDILRKKEKSPQTVSISNFYNFSSGEDLNEKLVNDDVLQITVKIIRELPEHYRDVLTCYYLGGFSVKEISDLLHRPLSTVRSQLDRGNTMLETAMEEAGLND